MDYRVVFYHQHAVSARTRFLKFHGRSVLAFDPVPALAQLLDDDDSAGVAIHPAGALRQAGKILALPDGTLKAEPEFRCRLDVPGGVVHVILARMTTVNPPFESATQADAEFIDLMQARGLPQVELELLRRAYEFVLGG